MNMQVKRVENNGRGKRILGSCKERNSRGGSGCVFVGTMLGLKRVYVSRW